MNARLQIPRSVNPAFKRYELDDLEQCLTQCRTGDLREHMRLARKFRPLIRTLAEKRAGGPDQVREINRLCALGREGLYEAVLEYTDKVGVGHFRIFALDYIERAMDCRPKGFWQRLFRLRFRS